MDNNTFVKPIKQGFVKNGRMMPMTRIMLTLLAGWAGQGGCIKTTTGIIGKHLGRCRRQIFRYLQDAVEEGYLTYSRTKDRVGRYTGINIWLNFAAIRFSNTRKPKKAANAPEMLDVTQESETNSKFLYNKEADPKMEAALGRFAATLDFELPDLHPY